MRKDNMLNPIRPHELTSEAGADFEYIRQLQAYFRTETQHVLSYRELAK